MDLVRDLQRNIFQLTRIEGSDFQFQIPDTLYVRSF
ncbi:uncharacterized protein J3R85_012531 [Psidium guajava]|nr:uncharacterized protein J3R85_012531 [Psidium guajava]